MQEILRLIIGIGVLILGIPIGNVLARNTPEELKEGKKWFYLILLVCFIGAIFSLIISNDALLFTFLFIAIVTSRSISYKERKKVKNKEKTKVKDKGKVKGKEVKKKQEIKKKAKRKSKSK